MLGFALSKIVRWPLAILRDSHENTFMGSQLLLAAPRDQGLRNIIMNKHSTTVAIWKDGHTQTALRANCNNSDDSIDFDKAAAELQCEVHEVNMCSEDQMNAYGVSYKDDMFQSFPGLAN